MGESFRHGFEISIDMDWRSFFSAIASSDIHPPFLAGFSIRGFNLVVDR
ncbi:hypothetical protein SynBIOSU31_02713 [Synechococcus sp. BIOS-U3-1]|nr:hypothetical protein SynBIOSU31_02713 [Synechococcus sp. BIOS-U3-1]